MVELDHGWYCLDNVRTCCSFVIVLCGLPLGKCIRIMEFNHVKFSVGVEGASQDCGTLLITDDDLFASKQDVEVCMAKALDG